MAQPRRTLFRLLWCLPDFANSIASVVTRLCASHGAERSGVDPERWLRGDEGERVVEAEASAERASRPPRAAAPPEDLDAITLGQRLQQCHGLACPSCQQGIAARDTEDLVATARPGIGGDPLGHRIVRA